MQARLKKQLMALGITGVLATVSSPVWASAFQLMEQNAAGVGDWHADGAAEADDASTGFYNPAGLTRIHNRQVVAGGVGIFTDVKFTGKVYGSTDTPPATDTTTQGGVSRFVPNFHYAHPINERTVFGFGITTPFGLATDYPGDSPVALSTTKTEVKTINLNPNIGYKVNDKLSLGVGVNAQYLEGRFDNFITDLLPGINLADSNKGDAWGVGWNVGALYEVSDATRVGLSYRSKIKFTLKGTGTAATNIGGTVSSPITSDITLPGTAMASVYHDVNEQWSVMGSATYTQWNVLKDLTIKNAPNPSGGVLDITIPQNFKNTWNFSAGAHYKVNEKWLLKGGLGFDQTPTNDTDRNLRLPDSDRIIAAAGVRYQANRRVAVDAGAMHLFMRKAHLNNTGDLGSVTVITSGSAKGYANVVGMQLTWDIDKA